MKTITPCCGGRKCPKLYVYKEDKIEIADDFKNTVILNKKQALEIARAILKESN